MPQKESPSSPALNPEPNLHDTEYHSTEKQRHYRSVTATATKVQLAVNVCKTTTTTIRTRMSEVATTDATGITTINVT
jgi:hypothetical protein